MNEMHRLEEELMAGAPLVDHRWDGVLATGQESADELRALAHRTADKCPRGQFHPRCPFQMMRGLSRASRSYLLSLMDRNALLQVFAIEQACRLEAEHRPLGNG